MKNQFFVFIFFGLLISSCGTTTHYASSSYDDAIYYNPQSSQQITKSYATNDELQNLKNKTKEPVHSINQNKVQTVINLDNVVDTSIVVGEESYEAILTKFDSPKYVININVVDSWGGNNYWNDPYWSYGYSNPWYYRHSGFGYGGYGWYSPFYSYYGYWDSPWYNPWYGGFGYNGYYGYNGFYGGYYGGYYEPWYYSSGSGNNQNNDSRGKFYGRRVNTDEGGHRDGNSAISDGSYVRRDAKLEQIRGGNLTNNRSESAYSGRSGSMYKRDPGTGVSGAVYNNDVVRTNSGTNTSRGTSYQRSVSNVRQTSGTTSGTSSANASAPVYRRGTQSSSNTNSGSTGNNTYQRNNTPSRQSNYTPPPVSRNVPASNPSTGNSGSSSGDRSSSSGGGSVYRR